MKSLSTLPWASAESDPVYARSTGEKLLTLARKENNTPYIASAFDLLGNIALEQSDYTEATRHFEERLAIERERDGDIVTGLVKLSHVAFKQGDSNRVKALCAEALALYRKAESRLGRMRTGFHVINELALAQGDYTRARDWLNECLEIAQKDEDMWEVSRHTTNWAMFRSRRGSMKSPIRITYTAWKSQRTWKSSGVSPRDTRRWEG